MRRSEPTDRQADVRPSVPPPPPHLMTALLQILGILKDGRKDSGRRMTMNYCPKRDNLGRHILIKNRQVAVAMETESFFPLLGYCPLRVNVALFHLCNFF